MSKDNNITYTSVIRSEDLDLSLASDPLGNIVYKKEEGGMLESLFEDEENAFPLSVKKDCEVYNRAVLDSPTRFVCLISQGYEGVRMSEFPDAPFTQEELEESIFALAAHMVVVGSSIAGVSHQLGQREWCLTPFSTIESFAPDLLLIDKEKFLGFRDLPFPYCAYDLQLRSLNKDQCLLSSNILFMKSEGIDKGSQECKDFLKVAGDYAKPATVKKKDFMKFKTKIVGV